MPTHIGEIPLPRRSPHFLACRRHLRVHASPAAAIGLSGGPDSLALVAAALAEGVQVRAICVDHQLQPGSREVAEQAAATARRMGAEAVVAPVTVDARAGGMEAAARRARYAALRAQAGSRPVWVAHTLDDQAETVLLSALRGRVAGMAVSDRHVQRPFLGLRRADTVGACAELGLRPWQDPLNEDASVRRIAIRSKVMPLLEEITGADVAPALARAAATAREDADFIAAQVPEIDSDGVSVSLASAPRALRVRSIIAFLRHHDAAVSAATIDAVDALLVNWHGQGGVAVGKTAEGLRLVVRRKSGTLVMDESP
ncbi:tRNA(Ile)-lysidine synthase [Corynebacterium ciconiae DSM 44920]|uniref:tRNA lysidine(34) synthetase TilS n=1 Tax=Corynebacterium ciconiae TaxID=227319 RepID=UPI00036F62D3|nr:tRNA lysidine(34) synthetase TilS [Corynebacterium ciconiae]WKD61969.1 tRNA(Ile)-lysidine synthase [Corynebacterium ciconiae DSM 44920]